MKGYFYTSLPILKTERLINQSLEKKLAKKLRKIKGRKSKPKVEEVNQFMTASIHFENPEQNRSKIMADLEKVHQGFTRKYVGRLRRRYSKDPELEAMKDAFKLISKHFTLDVKRQLANVDAIPTSVVEVVDTMYSKGVLHLWVSDEIDHFAMGGERLNIDSSEVDPNGMRYIAEELTLLALGREIVPVLVEKTKSLTGKISEFIQEIIAEISGFNSLGSNEQQRAFEELYSIIMGKILGIRESMNLATKQFQRFITLDDELKELSKDLSMDLRGVYKQFLSKSDLEESIDSLRRSDVEISENYSKLRDLLNRISNLPTGEPNMEDIHKFVEFTDQIYVKIEKFRFLTESYEDLPNFTSTSGKQSDDYYLSIVDDALLTEQVIFARNIFKTFPLMNTTVYALRGIDLDVSPGEFVAIMGPSGSGKTTLLNILSGLEKPDSGVLFVDKTNMLTTKRSDLVKMRKDVFAFVYQSYNLLTVLKSRENVSLPADLGSENIRKGKRKRSKMLLQNVGLEKFGNTRPQFLSGGQQQRVTIARALMNNPKIIFADEPTGDLDKVTGNQVMEIFEELNADGVTVIIVTHDSEVAKRAQKIIHMRDGKIEKIVKN